MNESIACVPNCNAGYINSECLTLLSLLPSPLHPSPSLSPARGAATAELQVPGGAESVEGAKQLGEPAHRAPLQGNVSAAANLMCFFSSCCAAHLSRSPRIITTTYRRGGFHSISTPPVPAGSAPRLLKPVCIFSWWSS